MTALGDPDAGLEAARTARRLAPYTTAPLYEALCLYETGRPELAIETLQPLAGDDDDHAVPWTGDGPRALLVQALVAVGETGRAEQVASRIDPVAFPFAAAIVGFALGDDAAAARAVGRIDRLTAWPCLVVHHFQREFWAQDHVRPHHQDLVGIALRSWSMQPT